MCTHASECELTGNFDECVRNDTDDTDVCVSLIVMPGICASEYALPLLSFNGAGGILYGGLGIFVASTTVDDFNVNLADALVVVVNDDGDGDEEGAMDDDSDVDTDGDGDFGD